MASLISDSACAVSPPLGAGFHTVQIILSSSLCNFHFPSLLLHSPLCPPSTSQRSLSPFFKAHWSQRGICSHCPPVWDLENLKGQSPSVTLFLLLLDSKILSSRTHLLCTTTNCMICMCIKYTHQKQIAFITGKPICGATACEGNHLEFITYASKSICIQMCNARPPTKGLVNWISADGLSGKCCASNKVPLLQSRAAVRVNSCPAGRHISLCSPCVGLLFLSVPMSHLPFSRFAGTFPAETLIIF